MHSLQVTARLILALWLALAPVKAWAQSRLPLLGAGGGSVVAKSFTLRTASPVTTTGGSSGQTVSSLDLGGASPVCVIAGVGAQGTPTLTSVTVNGASLTQDQFSASTNTAGIYSGTITPTAGATNTVVANWSGAAFTNRYLWIVTATGLTTCGKQTGVSFLSSGGAGTGSISVTAGDFMFLSQYQFNGNSAVFSTSTQTPDATNVTNFTASIWAVEAQWTIASTNASFSITNSATNAAGTAVAATYR